MSDTDTLGKQRFSIKRSDLYLNFRGGLEALFGFAAKNGEEFKTESAVEYDEAGCDFQTEYQPLVLISPPALEVFNQSGFEPSDLEVHISVSDRVLHRRFLIYSKSLKDVRGQESVPIDLTKISQASFFSGFEVRCSLHLSSISEESSEALWHKSQCLVNREWEIKPIASESGFEISWEHSEDPDSKECLLYVEWESSEVSNLTSSECFTIVGNAAIKSQFNRLERHRLLGNVAARLLASPVLKELTMECLISCDLEGTPAPESLHEKIKMLVEGLEHDFDALANDIRSDDWTTKKNAEQDVDKLIQKQFKLGSNLLEIRFGGAL